MIRHVEMAKILVAHENKLRSEILEEIVSKYEKILDATPGVVNCDIEYRSDSIDPLDADLLVIIDFEDEDALSDYDLDMDRIGIQFKIAEYAETILDFDYEI